VLVSDPKGRDIKIDAYTLSFHGRLLFEGAEVSLNYGQRYVLSCSSMDVRFDRNLVRQVRSDGGEWLWKIYVSSIFS
jgi:hypothetical protein